MNSSLKQILEQSLFQLKAASKKIVIVSILGLSLWSLGMPAHAVPYQEGERGIQSTELYDQIQEEKGGMNNFDDADPRRNTSRADAKAQKLSDAAARRKATASDPLETAREAISDLTDEIVGTADDISDNDQETSRDVRNALR